MDKLPSSLVRVLNSAPVSLGFALLVACLTVTTQSLWIDEAQTYLYASQPSFSAWIHQLGSSPKSEAQMPLGMAVAFISGKCFGTSELGLRVINVLWTTLAALAVFLIARRTREPGFFWVFILSPFLWYYTGEARPYALLICAGAWLLYGWMRWVEEETPTGRTMMIFGAAALIGFATHALFGFVLLGFGIAMLPDVWKKRRNFTKRTLWPLSLIFLLLVATASYYAWTVHRGSAGARLWTVGIQNVGFCLYEMLGFSGLGLPRHELRELGRDPRALLRAFGGVALLAMSLLAVAYFIAFAGSWRARREQITRTAWLAALVGFIALCLTAKAAHFPFWGRHCAAFLPLVLFASWRGVLRIPSFWLRRAVCFLLLGLLAISALRQRLDEQFRRDDYRLAARVARTALEKGLNVWWSADGDLATYYGLPISDPPTSQSGHAPVLFFAPKELLERLPEPHLVVQSKPDIFDSAATVTGYIERAKMKRAGRIPGFVFWTKSQTADDLIHSSLDKK
jgi:hypothetical protein